MTSIIEYIVSKGNTLAVLLRSAHRTDGISFFTPGDFSQQLGYMNRPEGYVIPPPRPYPSSQRSALHQ
jgi:hypothetical protein